MGHLLALERVLDIILGTLLAGQRNAFELKWKKDVCQTAYLG